ncbi:MAG: KOW domain-containing RNA-binding protein [Clostridia bacterium]|nr:KOW domain-containing RNA-binding protein [Clostridia bacterium]
MKVKTPVIGGICQSIRGRDKDRFYLIRLINADGTVGVVDGNFKKLASPKKKNLKHLRLLPEKAESIAAKFESGAMVYDSEIYSALKNYNTPRQEQKSESNDVKE